MPRGKIITEVNIQTATRCPCGYMISGRPTHKKLLFTLHTKSCEICKEKKISCEARVGFRCADFPAGIADTMDGTPDKCVKVNKKFHNNNTRVINDSSIDGDTVCIEGVLLNYMS